MPRIDQCGDAQVALCDSSTDTGGLVRHLLSVEQSDANCAAFVYAADDGTARSSNS